MKAKNHPQDKPRGVRDPKNCKKQAGGHLVFLYTLPGVYDRQPMFWTDRPRKFAGHISMFLSRPGAKVEDVKWKQLGSSTYWRIPNWPDGKGEAK